MDNVNYAMNGYLIVINVQPTSINAKHVKKDLSSIMMPVVSVFPTVHHAKMAKPVILVNPIPLNSLIKNVNYARPK